MLKIAAGSFGEAIASYQQLQAIPIELLKAVTKVPSSYREALELAKQIDQAINKERKMYAHKRNIY